MEDMDFRREVLDGVAREIEEAKVGFTARPCAWLRITITENDGTYITVEEQTVDLVIKMVPWVGENGPMTTREEKERNIGAPVVVRMPKGRLWKYFEHMPDVYSMRP